ncbi:MAG: glycosyltransferase [Lactobacillus crispatus]
MPKVSILMSIYNCKNFDQLEKSIKSIIEQTYSDWELILYNDGSNDNGKTSCFLQEISKTNAKIRIIDCVDNHGLAFAKDQMLKVAKGQYITAQDDNDVSDLSRISIEVDFLDKHPSYAFVGTLGKVFDENGVWGHYSLKEKPEKDSFLWSSPFLHPSVMFRREVLAKVGNYRVSKETRRAEDYDLFFRLYAQGYKGFNIQKELYSYRINNDPHQKYRSMNDRIQEAKVRYKGYKLLNMSIRGIPYIIKPILIGLIPQPIFYKIKKKQY